MNGRKQGSRPDRIWYSSAEEIAEAIGRGRHDVARLVKSDGLPAFKFYGKWTARIEDVQRWTKAIARHYRRNPDPDSEFDRRG